MNDNLVERVEEQETPSGVLADASMNAETVDLYPRVSRVITQRIRALPNDEYQALEQAANAYAYRSAPDVRPKPIGVGSKVRQRYLIESRLGSGGMGTVYKALDVYRRGQDGIGSYVAIKVLHERTDDRPEVLDKLRREFYCAQALTHRSVVKVYDLDQDGSLDFFTMEWLDGESLSKVLKRFHPRPLPRPAAWAILREIGEGLVHAHDRKVVHADLKPQNIMITQEGEVRILDFGASSGSGRGQTTGRSKSMAVTPAYASCELLGGHAPDPRDDVFALACLSYELLAGEHPFGYRRAIEARDAGMVAKRPPGISTRQWRALQQGLSWYRKDRSISVRDWLSALDVRAGELYSLERLNAAAAAPPPPPARLERRMPTGVAVTLAVLMLALPVGWLLSHRNWTAHDDAPPPSAQGINSLSSGQEPEQAALLSASPAAASGAMSGESVAAAVPTQLIPATKPNRPALAAAPPKLALAASYYRIHPQQRYAEIHVHRTVATQAASSFEWWTEDGTALAGFDYLGQARSIAYFPPGGLNTVLFVKVLANEARRQAATFNVVIGNPSHGATVGQRSTRIDLLAANR